MLYLILKVCIRQKFDTLISHGLEKGIFQCLSCMDITQYVTTPCGRYGWWSVWFIFCFYVWLWRWAQVTGNRGEYTQKLILNTEMVLVLRFCIFCGSQLKYSPPICVFISRHMGKGWDWHTVSPLVDNGQTTPYLSEKWVKIKIQLLVRTSCDALSYIMMCLPVIQKYFY